MIRFFRYFIGTRFVSDILRDKGSPKFSMTKVLAAVFSALLLVILTGAMVIMFQRQEADESIIAEIMFFILTLLGFKNLRADSTAEPDVKPARSKAAAKSATQDEEDAAAAI